MELNPNHPVTQQTRQQWHKVAALIMAKLGKTEVEISIPDILEMTDRNMTIVVQERADSMLIRLVDDKTAHELARQAGGRPIDS